MSDDPTPERPETLKQDLPPFRLPVEAPLPGSNHALPQVAGTQRYAILEEIARGGMGIVYRAEDLIFGRGVAVKVLGPKLAGTEVVRFFEEARITGQLEHPSIPPVYELGVLSDGRPFLAMKLIKGKTLAKKLAERESLTEDLDDFAGIFEKVCEAVAFAHSKGIIHRDLKPANIMVGAFGEVQVMDWGLAKRFRADDRAEPLANDPVEGPEDRTRLGRVMGTPAYMPPEQAKGELDRVDERADVFALGGILCATLTGQPPYTGTRGQEVLQKAVAADLDDAHTRLLKAINGFAGNAELGGSVRLVGLARRCLDPDPEKRPAHAAAVAALIHSAREKSRQSLREVELDQAVVQTLADNEDIGLRIAFRRDVRRALLYGFVLAWLVLIADILVSHRFGDFTALGAFFGLVFMGVLYFAILAREQ